MKGFEAWLPENGPQTDEEWFQREVGWCKTYLKNGIPIPKDYFSEGVEEAALKVVGYEGNV